jgi:hypothetical protein
MASTLAVDRRDFQALGFGQLGLTRIRGQEQFAFERQRAGHVEQVDGASPDSSSLRLTVFGD